jgi:hypothetical protein
MEKCHNNKINLLCCFVNFKKYFDKVDRTNLWNRLEEVKFPFELRVIAVRSYENFISKFRNTEGWSKDINCNIGVKQGCLDDVGCVNLTLTSIVIILILYIDAIVLMARSPYDLSKQPRILKEFFSSTSMTTNTDKMKVMIIKSKNITYDTLAYENNSLEEFLHTNISESIFITRSMRTIPLRK